jgi:hypothetical protein
VKKKRIGLSFVGVLLLLLLGSSVVVAREFAPAREAARPGPAAASEASAPVSAEVAPRAATLACPANPAGLPNVLEPPGEQFCVFYDSADNTLAQAQAVADFSADYWDRYPALGFLAPLVSGVKLEVRLIHAACNGVAWNNHIEVYDGCFAWDEYMQYVVGHELFHRVQFNHDSDFASTWTNSAWVYEGTARSMEDKSFANIDTWANCLSPNFSYCREVNNYLVAPNNDVTSWSMRYKSALWWTYFAEQFGTVTTEPQRGVDALVQVWDSMATLENIAAVNNALSILGAGMNFDAAFVKFAAANYAKDLSGLPDDSYFYQDERQTGNPAPYGPISPHDGGTINSTSTATWGNRLIKKYGADYFVATPSATDCPVVTASFHNIDSGPAFYHVVTQDGGVFKTHVQGSGTDWTQSFLNDGISEIAAIAGSRSTSSHVDIELSCADPVLDIKLPNQLAPEYVGPFGAPAKFVAQVLVTNGAPDAPVVDGLTNADFKAEVGGIPALVVGGGPVQEQYFLQILAPNQAANGPYDLEIFLEEPGTTNVIASDTETEAIIYDSTSTDHVLVIDRSGSMGYPTQAPLQAAKTAANFFIDVMNSAEGLSVVGYNHNVDPVPPLGMAFATLPHRNDAHTFVNALTPSGATSIGDGLDEAVNQRDTSPTGNTRCMFTLLSDGMENSTQFWADVQADVVATGCPVLSIAFGPSSDETLLQSISTATGGSYFYNDVFVSTLHNATAYSPDDMFFDLVDTYEYAQAQGEGRQRLLAEKGIIPSPMMTQTHTVVIDPSVTEVVFALDWNQSRLGVQFLLQDPGGVIIDPSTLPGYFASIGAAPAASLHMGVRIPDPDPGTWQMLVFHDVPSWQSPVPYQVLVSGRSNLTAVLLLPGHLGMQYFTGNWVPIFALLSSNRPIPDAMLMAMVIAPDGTETMVPLADDGEHGDGAAGDGLYAGKYTLVNQANAVNPPQEPDVPPEEGKDQGSYRVRLLAQHPDFQREAMGSFAVPAGADDNGNGLPDTYEQEHGVSDPDGDPDLDLLDTGDEYYAGTDPNDSDTDGGGENDWSEVVLHGKDPLDPSDDEIEEPDFFQTMAVPGGDVVLNYDVKAEYVMVQSWRATNPDGPWTLALSELPLTGVFTETGLVLGTPYYYQLYGRDGDNHWSALLSSEPVTPALDPIPPEANILVDGGAPSTADLNVELSFSPYLDDLEEIAFSDITEMQLSNDPSLAGASWQTFEQDVPWKLLPGLPGSPIHVYAIFKDDAGNVSVGVEVGSIIFGPYGVFLPTVVK